MLRREFSTALLGAGLTCAAPYALAQNTKLNDTDFTRITPSLPTEKGKIEVLEFFWYGCTHCFAFQPLVQAWAKKLPSDVLFKKTPVAFRAHLAIHQQLFYTLEAMNQLNALHGKVFHTMHVEKQPLDKDEDVIAWAAKNSLNQQQFAETFNSFSVKAKIKQASRLAENYRIESVPTLAIHGRYTTSGSLAGTAERALLVADELIARARKGA